MLLLGLSHLFDAMGNKLNQLGNKTTLYCCPDAAASKHLLMQQIIVLC